MLVPSGFASEPAVIRLKSSSIITSCAISDVALIIVATKKARSVFFVILLFVLGFVAKSRCKTTMVKNDGKIFTGYTRFTVQNTGAT